MDQDARLDAIVALKEAVKREFGAGHLHAFEADELIERLNQMAMMSASTQESKARYGYVR